MNGNVEQFAASVIARDSDGEPYTVLAISGETDVTNSGQLRELLDAEAVSEPSRLFVDLSGLNFMDSSGLHALFRASRALSQHGGVLFLIAPQEPVERMLRLTAADQLMPVYARLEDAITSRSLPHRYIQVC